MTLEQNLTAAFQAVAADMKIALAGDIIVSSSAPAIDASRLWLDTTTPDTPALKAVSQGSASTATNWMTNPRSVSSGTPAATLGGTGTLTAATGLAQAWTGGTTTAWRVASTGAESWVILRWGVTSMPTGPCTLTSEVHRSSAGLTQLVVQWRDASDNFLTSDSPASVQVPAGAVTKLVTGATKPANAAYARVLIDFYDTVSSDILYATNVSLMAGASQTTYFDGSMPAAANTTYSWSGPTNASTSVASTVVPDQWKPVAAGGGGTAVSTTYTTIVDISYEDMAALLSSGTANPNTLYVVKG